MSDSSERTPTIATIDEIRDSFPALRRNQGSRTVGYFDAPGGTQVPAAVAEAVAQQMLHHNANAHWAFETSRELDEVIAASRSALADFLGGDEDEVVLGPNMTTLTFHVARALGRTWEAGDEVVVTELDHQANVSPWRDLEVERGVVVRTVPLVAETGDLDWADFEKALSSRTRLVAATAASNALGTIVDLERVRRLASSAGALLFVDAVHFAPHERIDVSSIGCDFLACSPYKFYGPHVGVLWGREALLREVLPPKLAPAPDAPPERWETGTLNHEGIAGAGAAVDYLASLGTESCRKERLDAVFAQLSRRGEALITRMWAGLAAIPGVTLYGPPPGHPRTPTLALTIDGLAPALAAAQLSADWGLFLSHGNFYASLVTERLGLEPQGLLRAGCACYTTDEEVGRLVAAVGQLAAPG
ncbi:MAG: cysteine desulfurase-like protein [Gemmatimonadetes bacterium]|nr:cysteine desulfurase-like protein [Gemmatimonadota bacterium]